MDLITISGIIGVVAVLGLAVYLLFFRKKKETAMSLRAVRGTTTARSASVTEGITSVVVNFTSVSLNGNGKRLTFNEERSIDFLSLEPNANFLLEGKDVPAGNYDWIRLVTGTDSYVEKDGVKYSLSIPSGNTSGLKLTQGFTVPENDVANFAIVFDVNKSLKEQTDGTYKMSPVLKLIKYVPPVVVEETVEETV